MATRQSAISLDMSEVVGLADKIGRLDGGALSDAITTSLNGVIDSTYEMARDRITVGINLSDAYLRKRMKVKHADKKMNEASITAAGDRPNMARLARFDAAMVLVPRKGVRPSRSRGLLPIGIPAGQKQGGASVTVTRGGTKTLTTGFMLRLKQGDATGEKFGVFHRRGGKLKHLYGPSVYQLFAYQIPRITDEVVDDLERTLMKKIDNEIDRIFA